MDYVEINHQWAPGSTTGSAYQNSDTKITTLEISPKTKFIVGSPATKLVTFPTFQKYFTTSDPSAYQKNNPWFLVSINGVAVQIEEYFIP